jgi:hypothetical protein
MKYLLSILIMAVLASQATIWLWTHQKNQRNKVCRRSA